MGKRKLWRVDKLKEDINEGGKKTPQRGKERRRGERTG